MYLFGVLDWAMVRLKMEDFSLFVLWFPCHPMTTFAMLYVFSLGLGLEYPPT